ncbi:membrane dipeptidase, partial [Pseudorhodoplanes sp.]|uniref:membrane dipeptidase n=1 Tax=Pseudorhodoplanes sp. TaxID=1934341 RepID=UPI003D0F600B
ARLVEQIGIEHVGIGTDQGGGHTDQSIQYARMGTWTRTAQPRRVHEKPEWAKDGSAGQIPNIFKGLHEVGFQDDEIRLLMGENWIRLFRANFG